MNSTTITSFIVLASLLAAEIQAKADELYSHELDGGARLVVRDSLVAPVAQLAPLLTELQRANVENARVISVTLESADAPPVLLASHLQLESGVIDAGFSVLNALVDPGVVILAVTSGPYVKLWRIEVGVHPPQMYRRLNPEAKEQARRIEVGAAQPQLWVTLNRWQIQALASRLDNKSVRADLSRLPDGRVAVAVHDLRAHWRPPPPPALYEQQPDQWQFRIVCPGAVWPPVPDGESKENPNSGP